MLRTSSTVHVTPRFERAMALFHHAKTYGIVSAILFGAGHSFRMVDNLEPHARIAGIVNADPASDVRVFDPRKKIEFG